MPGRPWWRGKSVIFCWFNLIFLENLQYYSTSSNCCCCPPPLFNYYCTVTNEPTRVVSGYCISLSQALPPTIFVAKVNRVHTYMESIASSKMSSKHRLTRSFRTLSALLYIVRDRTSPPQLEGFLFHCDKTWSATPTKAHQSLAILLVIVVV